MRGRFDWGAASSCCNCWATSNGGNGCEGGIFLFSSFVTTPPSVAVDDAAGGVGSGVSCAATWRLFSPSASVRGAAELPEAAPSSCTMLKTLNCWISQQTGFTQLEQQMATRPHAYILTCLHVDMLTFLQVYVLAWLHACMLERWHDTCLPPTSTAHMRGIFDFRLPPSSTAQTQGHNDLT